ncbi:hypothetical protein [Paludisphaera rhizosphaerae]|uniref:hypothetical protein n=1 Tax=Paludisphaera rhizosphaerae TaxID=2711216 RepID=UPI0013EB1BEB|nr:hypothetical protein [Paludisphaera rhizosphaerae]
MSLEDYNRGYNAGSTGFSTGAPRSAAEVVGYWNGEADRRRWEGQQAPPASYDHWTDAVRDYGAAGALTGLIVGGIFTKSILGALVAATTFGLAAAGVLTFAVGVVNVLGWIFGGIPKTKLALVGGACGAAAHWAFASQLGAYAQDGPMSFAILGAVVCIGLAAAWRVATAPFRLLARR